MEQPRSGPDHLKTTLVRAGRESKSRPWPTRQPINGRPGRSRMTEYVCFPTTRLRRRLFSHPAGTAGGNRAGLPFPQDVREAPGVGGTRARRARPRHFFDTVGVSFVSSFVVEFFGSRSEMFVRPKKKRKKKTRTNPALFLFFSFNKPARGRENKSTISHN